MTHGITFKHDDLSALQHLNVGPIHHITLSLVWFQHWSMMTFQHLNINAWVSSTTLLYPWFSFNTEVWRPFCTYILCMDPFHHITLALDSVSTFRCDDLCALMCWYDRRDCQVRESENINVQDIFFTYYKNKKITSTSIMLLHLVALFKKC